MPRVRESSPSRLSDALLVWILLSGCAPETVRESTPEPKPSSPGLAATVHEAVTGLQNRPVVNSITAAVNLKVADELHSGTTDLGELRDLQEVCEMHASLVRSRAGYSARQLAGELGQAILYAGFLTADCDIAFQQVTISPGDSGVDIDGEFRVRAVTETCPSPTSSWVAESAWKAVPAKGRFSIHIPARLTGRGEWLFGLSTPRTPTFTNSPGNLKWVQLHEAFSARHLAAEAAMPIGHELVRGIPPALNRLLQTDGHTRFEKTGAAYGAGKCILEAASKEDGIDALAVLGAALNARDGDRWSATLQNATDESKEKAKALAAKICGMMQPKEWRSTERERLDARPVFISHAVVILELAKATDRQAVGKQLRSGSRIAVTRNAFSENSEGLLGRLEQAMEEFVSLLNGMAIESAGQDPDQVARAWKEARARFAEAGL